ncbi:MAG: HepT-like ribonuclease domain-containing protein [Cyanobacteria bacterium J06649_4]
MQQDSQYLIDIFQAAQRILEYTAGVSYQSFCEDVYLQDKIIRRLLTISKTAQRISYRTREQSAEISWRNINTLKQRILADDPHMDTEKVWRIIQTEIPALARAFSSGLFSQEPDAKHLAGTASF